MGSNVFLIALPYDQDTQGRVLNTPFIAVFFI